jgi:hypothetical protein
MDAKPVEPREPASGHYRAWLWAVAVALVIYPLSTGPVLKVVDVCGGNWLAVAETVYAPLAALENLPAAQRFFAWYCVDVWRLTVPFDTSRIR